MILSINNVGEDGNKMKAIRATDIAARLIESRPEYESCEELARRAGFVQPLTVTSLNRRKDIGVGLLYQVCKAFGYQIIIYNPNPKGGLEKMYVVGEKHAPIKPREQKNKMHISRDPYNNKLFRTVRKYKKRKGFKQVEIKAGEDNAG